MKSFAVTLMIFGACFLGYDYFLATPDERLVFERPAKLPQPVSVPVDDTKPAPQAHSRIAFNSQPIHSQQNSMSSPTAGHKDSKLNETAPAFQPAKLDSIEVLTSNWTTIPKSAFPRKVKLLEDTTFTLSIGSTTIRAGSEVVALSFENGVQLVAQDEKSQLRKNLPLDATDLKSRITSGYEHWKSKQTDEARKETEVRKLQPRPVTANPGSFVDSTGKPLRSADGAYPLLLSQINAGTPSDIKPANVNRWGETTMEKIKGMATWTIPVAYKTRTLFGDMDVETIAHVRDGKVIDWIYKGSGEPVP